MNAAQPRRGWLYSLGLVLLGPVLLGLTVWAFAALFFDFPVARLRIPIACFYLLAAMAAAVLFRRSAPIVLVGGFFIVVIWWLGIAPSNDRDWEADLTQTAWAEVNGERVTIHNVRNCEYRSEKDYTPRWESRTVDLGKLRGVDLAITFWGSKWMAHPIVSFQFEDTLPVCFSVETRLERGEEFSTLGGLYRHAELVCICADERDAIRVRSNFRQGEEVYLYHTTLSADKARERFLEYLATVNELHAKPRWYNALTTNCTTTIRTQHTAANRRPWDWRILLNGYMDQMLYKQGALVTDGLSFAQLKERAHINAAARAANDAPDFSARIRAGRPGFAQLD